MDQRRSPNGLRLTRGAAPNRRELGECVGSAVVQPLLGVTVRVTRAAGCYFIERS